MPQEVDDFRGCDYPRLAIIVSIAASIYMPFFDSSIYIITIPKSERHINMRAVKKNVILLCHTISWLTDHHFDATISFVFPTLISWAEEFVSHHHATISPVMLAITWSAPLPRFMQRQYRIAG